MNDVSSEAQQFLPGLDADGNTGAAQESVDECAGQSDALREDRSILESQDHITREFHKLTVQKRCTPTTPSEYTCFVDYSTFEHSLAETACRSKGGQYLEQDHLIVCSTPKQKDITKVLNYPLCLGKTCTDADIERIVADEVQELEDSLSEDLGAECTAEYGIDDDDKCFNRTDASSQTCGPFETQTRGMFCDCYSFCDGKLFACDGSNLEASASSCDEDLVSGCTHDLFGRNDIESSSAVTKFESAFVVTTLGVWLAVSWISLFAWES
jgi:hypothetical protein